MSDDNSAKVKAAKELEELRKQCRDKEAEVFRLSASPEELEAMKKRDEAKAKIAEMRNDPEIAKLLDEQAAAKATQNVGGGLFSSGSKVNGPSKDKVSDRGSRHAKKATTGSARRERSRSPRRSRDRAEFEDGEVSDNNADCINDTDSDTDSSEEDYGKAPKSKNKKDKLTAADPHLNPVLKVIGKQIRRNARESNSETQGKLGSTSRHAPPVIGHLWNRKRRLRRYL